MKRSVTAWYRDRVVDAFADYAAAALHRHGLKVEAKAKEELYPGHGKITGYLQRSITTGDPQRSASGVVVRVGTKGVPYARRINQRYEYLQQGLKKAGKLKL